jgi:alkanesulfonate monooxygenase SsuD/methylene tetrahydromethanopterin reductase-like flavin-dependent oxidoreductase (luciferase family)
MHGIKIGIGFGQWKYGLPAPELMCNYAEAAEAVGLDSMWLSDKIVSRPIRRGASPACLR